MLFIFNLKLFNGQCFDDRERKRKSERCHFWSTHMSMTHLTHRPYSNSKLPPMGICILILTTDSAFRTLTITMGCDDATKAIG